MIGKVLRGTDARRLLYYLYGPGKANEHTDPHLVAGFADPAELEPERRPSGAPDSAPPGRAAGPAAGSAGRSRLRQAGAGTARYAPPPRTVSCRTRSGRRSRPRSCTTPGSLPRVTTWGSGGWRSAMPPITFTSWRRWPARTAPGPRSGTTSTRVREACQEAERRFGLRRTAPGTAPPRGALPAPRRSRQPATGGRNRPGPPCAARCAPQPPGRPRNRSSSPASTRPGCPCACGTASPTRARSPGTRSALRSTPARDGGLIWYGGGKLAPDLTLPKLRIRWASPAGHGPADGTGLSAPAARAVLRSMVTRAAEHSPDETSFFARLRECGVLVRLRFSEADPGQVTGYSVSLPATRGRTEHRCGTGRAARRRAHPSPSARSLEPGKEHFRGHLERSGSPPRNATPSTPTRPARPPWRRSTSAAAPT